MTLVTLVLLAALIAISLYAILGGADFGGGVWDLLAFGPRAQAQRDAVTLAIGPVWEANHVWLIYVVVLLFTCFPSAFADLAIGLYFPLMIALVGIVLRGAAFVFRNYAADAEGISSLLGVVFGSASILAPIGFGLAVGALATGRDNWTGPFACCIALFAVALCAQIAAVFLTIDVTDRRLAEDFRARALLATLAVAAIGAVALLTASATEPFLATQLTSPRAFIAIAIAMLLGLVLLAALSIRRFKIARILVGAEVVAILAGWFGAQAPYLIPANYTYEQAAASNAMLLAFLIASAAGALILFPSLWLLFTVFKRTPLRPKESPEV